MKAVTALLRGFQLLCGLIIFGLSVSLARGQVIGHVPIRTGFICAVGAWTIVASLIGLAGLFIDHSIKEVVLCASDGLAAVLLLIGGLIAAVGVGTSPCGYTWEVVGNSLLNCGTTKDIPVCASEAPKRCKAYKADAAFMFIGFLTCGAVLAWTFKNRRS